MSSRKNKDEPEHDPYDVLGIKPEITDAAINKAYRKKALKLHPDKQSSSLSPQEAEQVANEFQKAKEARAFLLEPENNNARIKYDAKRASIQKRRQADAKREMGMNERRKRMRDELKQKEEEALSSTKKAKTSKSKYGSKRKQDDDLIDKLRKEGSRMRQEQADKGTQAATTSAYDQVRQEKLNKKERERLLQNRQVRMKWSRKKMTTSPSEHTLATLLSRFGNVEEVEMLGSKGNLALITFAEPSSCRSCVDAYSSSDEMRASFVGPRKEVEEARSAANEQEDDDLAAASSSRQKQNKDNESLYDRKLRQAAEREQLLRDMEAEGSAGKKPASSSRPAALGMAALSRMATAKEPPNLSSRCVSVQFPSTEAYRRLNPIQKLEKTEHDILAKILSGKVLARLAEIQSRS